MTTKTNTPLSQAARDACSQYVNRAWASMRIATTRHRAFHQAVEAVEYQLILKLNELGIDPETVDHDVVMSLLSGGVVVE